MRKEQLKKIKCYHYGYMYCIIHGFSRLLTFIGYLFRSKRRPSGIFFSRPTWSSQPRMPYLLPSARDLRVSFVPFPLLWSFAVLVLDTERMTFRYLVKTKQLNSASPVLNLNSLIDLLVTNIVYQSGCSF